MVNVEKVLAALGQIPSKNDRLVTTDMVLSAGTPGDEAVIAEYQAERPLAIRAGVATDLSLVAHETHTTDNTAGDAETIDLSHNLVDAPSIPQDVLVYEEGEGRVEPDSVDYDANTVTYTDDGTENVIHLYYATDEQARVEVRKVSPKGQPETIKEIDAGLATLRDQGRDPIDFAFSHPLDAVIPTDWRLEVVIEGPYGVVWDHDGDGAIEAQSLVDIPIRRASQNIEGLGAAVKTRF